MSEEKIDELLRLMRSVVPDTSDMSDAGKVGFVYRQGYDPEVSYEEMDVVLYGQSLWTPKMDTTGNPPPDQSQEGQEDATENEFWTLFLPGALGKDYVKKTDYAVAPTEDDPGRAGVVKPDGKTITVDEDGTIHGSAQVNYATTEKAGIVKPDGQTIEVSEDGTITGASVKTFETEEDYKEAFKRGEVKPGTTVIIKNSYGSASVDSELSEDSENPVQNKAVTAALNEIKNSLGGISFSVTESGLVRASWEDKEGA